MIIGEVNNRNYCRFIEMILMYSIIIIISYAFVELEKQIEQKKIAKDMELRKEQEREERENQRILKEQQLLKEREEREILNERMNKQASLNTTDPSHSKPNSATSSSSSIAPTQSLPLSARSVDIAAVRKPITPNPIVSEPLYSIPEGTDRSSSLGNTFDRSSPVGDMNTAVTAAVRGQTTSAQSSSSSSSSSSFRRDNRNHHLFNKIDINDDDNDVNDDIGYSNNSNRDFSDNNEVVVPNKVSSSAAAVVSKQNTYTPRIDHNQQRQQNDGSLMYKGNWNHLFDKNNDNGFDNGIGYSKPSSTVANRNHGNDRNKLFDQNDDDDDDHSNNNNNRNPMMSRTNDHGSKGGLLFDSTSVFRTDDVMHTIPPIMSRQKKQLNHVNSQIDHGDDDIQVHSESRSHRRDGRLHQVDHNDNDRPKQLNDRIDTSHHTSIIQQQQKQGHHDISTDASNQNYTRGDHLFASSSSTSIDQSQQQRIITPPPLSPTKKKVEQQLLSKLNLSSINSARGYNVVRETKAQPSTHYPDTNPNNANAAVFGNHHQLQAHHSNNNNRERNSNKNVNISLNRTLEFESKFLLPDGTLIDNDRSNNSKGKSSVDDDDDDVLDQLIRSSDAYRGDKEKKKDGSAAAAAVSCTSSSTTNRGGDSRTSAGSMEILSDIQGTLQSLQHLDDYDDVYDDRKVTNSKGNSTLIQSTVNKGHQQKQSQAANVQTSSSSVSSIVNRPKSSDSLNRDYDVLHVNKRNNRKLELLRKINGANQIQASHLLSSFDQLDITTAQNSASNYSSRPSTTNSLSSSNSNSRPNSAHIKVSNILQEHFSRNGTTTNNRNGSDSARYRYDDIHQSIHDLQDMRSLYNNSNNINSSNNNYHKRRNHLPSPDDPDFDNYSDYGL
jgi:hypothetical protein